MSAHYLHYLFVSFFLGICVTAYSQEVEHNYAVEPQFTSCDSLNLQDADSKVAIEIIRQTKFRLQESFKLTRLQGFRGGEFYSCNGAYGFLIIKFEENELLFLDVKKDNWETMKGSQDPEGYFLEIKDGLRIIN